jgi:hypothetical protein
MAIDRARARRRVKTITAWAAGGAAALTAAFAFGAARGNHTAARAASPAQSASQDTSPQEGLPQTQTPDPQGAYPQDPQGSKGFQPPSASTGPPAGMSGGS